MNAEQKAVLRKLEARRRRLVVKAMRCLSLWLRSELMAEAKRGSGVDATLGARFKAECAKVFAALTTHRICALPERMRRRGDGLRYFHALVMSPRLSEWDPVAVGSGIFGSHGDDFEHKWITEVHCLWDCVDHRTEVDKVHDTLEKLLSATTAERGADFLTATWRPPVDSLALVNKMAISGDSKKKTFNVAFFLANAFNNARFGFNANAHLRAKMQSLVENCPALGFAQFNLPATESLFQAMLAFCKLRLRTELCGFYDSLNDSLLREFLKGSFERLVEDEYVHSDKFKVWRAENTWFLGSEPYSPLRAKPKAARASLKTSGEVVEKLSDAFSHTVGADKYTPTVMRRGRVDMRTLKSSGRTQWRDFFEPRPDADYCLAHPISEPMTLLKAMQRAVEIDATGIQQVADGMSAGKWRVMAQTKVKGKSTRKVQCYYRKD